MIENIQIVNKNGDGMFVEGISYIEIVSTGKKYLFYTLNEKVDNDLTKIYIAETTPNAGEAQPIEQEVWDSLRKLMVKISHKEPLDDVNFLSMSNVIFNVGDAKKLAVTAVAKQAFKDAQITSTLPSNQANESVVAGTTSFFRKEEDATQQVINTEDTSQSIFSNPPAPMESTPLVEPVQTVVQPVVETPVVETPIVETPVAESPVMAQPVAEATPVVETPVIEATPTVITQEVPTVQATPVIVDNIPTTPTGEVIISDEEALKAIDIIQQYIDNET